jgi:hypothetical protein
MSQEEPKLILLQVIFPRIEGLMGNPETHRDLREPTRTSPHAVVIELIVRVF